MNRRLLLFFSLFMVIMGMDFISKIYVHSHIPYMNWASPVFPYGGIAVFENWNGIDFSINHVTNKGAAWGMLASWQTGLLCVRLLVIGGIVAYLYKAKRPLAKQIPLVLIVSGALGNVLDYFLYGHVVDMYHFRFWGYAYPVFNIADSAIFCGIAWLFLTSFKKRRAAALT